MQHRFAAAIAPLLALQWTLPASAQNATTGPAGNSTAPFAATRPPRPWDTWLAPYLDGPLQRFLGDIVAWVLVGLLVVLVVAPLLKWATRRIPGDLDSHVVGIVSKPAFILVFAFGFVDSLHQFDISGRLGNALDNTWNALLIVVLTYVAFRLWHEILRGVGRQVSQRTETDLDDQLFPLVDKTGGVIIIIVGIWLTIESFGIDMTLFAAGGAIGGLVIAFAAQDSLANFFAGVQILLDRPFREGDRIEIKDENTWGDVVEIGLRTTRVRTRDNRLVAIPNSLIGNNAVINHSYPDSSYRLTVPIGIAYGSDIEHARGLMVSAVQAVEGVDPDQRVEALFRGFGDSSLDFHVRYWIPSYVDTRRIEDRVNTALERALREGGVEIPFPQRVLWNGAAPSQPVVDASAP